MPACPLRDGDELDRWALAQVTVNDVTGLRLPDANVKARFAKLKAVCQEFGVLSPDQVKKNDYPAFVRSLLAQLCEKETV